MENEIKQGCVKCVALQENHLEEHKLIIIDKLRKTGCYKGYGMEDCPSPLVKEAMKPLPTHVSELDGKIKLIQKLLDEATTDHENASDAYKACQQTNFRDQMIRYGNRADAFREALKILEGK